MNRHSLAFVLALSLLSSVFAQQQQPSGPNTSAQQDEEVVKITTNLVQVDAVVTDRSGKVVTDLKPEEFQIFEDGRAQPITNFSFVSTSAGAQSATANRTIAAAAKPKRGAVSVPVPPARLRPDQVRRTVALVVDDLGLSFESMHFVREGLRKFVDEQMQQGDLVAIIRTGGGIGALQQFTTDKQLLHAAIEHINWDVRGRSGFGAFAAIQNDPFSNFANSRPMVSGGSGSGTSSQGLQNTLNNQSPERDARNKENDFKEEVFSVGTLGAINYVVRGLKDLPGRKSVVLVSDSLAIFNPQGDTNDRVLEAMRRLTDLANRASVVIYTIDARGLPVNLFQAQDQPQGVVKLPDRTKVSGLSAPATAQNLTRRSQELIRSQDGLNFLAAQTGGFFVHNNNYLNDGLRMVMDDQKGFYLIGYRPEESTFDPKTGRKRFHDISVRVTRPGLSVRTRTGFFGISDENAKPVHKTPAEQLLAAITSPFASGDVNLRLTSLFFNDAQSGSFMRSLIYVDAQSLTFAEQADGSRKANMDVVAVTFGADGTIVNERIIPETVAVSAEQYRNILKSGLVFGINLPVRKAGAYQLRVAVRDRASERVGSASQFIEVPRLDRNRLTLSGIYMASNRQATVIAEREKGAMPALTSTREDTTFGELDPESGPAVRRFQAGTVIDYGFEVYNAKLDRATGRPQLQTQVRLFRDNQQVYAGRVIPIRGEAADAKRVVAIAHLQLGTNLVPGEYLLQVIVIDQLAKEKQQLAQQWIEFEIR